MNLQENISRIKEVMGLNHDVLVEQLRDQFKNKKSSKGFFIMNKFQVLNSDEEPILDNIPNLYPKSIYYIRFNMKNISNEKSPIFVESVKFNNEKGINNPYFTQQLIRTNRYANISFDFTPFNTSDGKTYNDLIIDVNFIVANKNVRDTIRIKFPYYAMPLSSRLEVCKSKYNTEELKNSIEWFKKWLNNPITKQKFGKIFNYDKNTIDKHFTNYMKILDQIKIEYTFSDKPNGAWVRPGLLQGLGITTGGFDIPITINCFEKGNYGPTETLFIHEIQHILSSYHKLHPFRNDIFKYYSEKNWDVSDSSSVKNEEELRNMMRQEGFESSQISELLDRYKWKVANDRKHLESANENLSSLFEVRKDLELKPGQGITKEMLMLNIKKDSVIHFLSQWIFSKMKLNDWLNYKNSMALNKKGPTNKSSLV